VSVPILMLGCPPTIAYLLHFILLDSLIWLLPYPPVSSHPMGIAAAVSAVGHIAMLYGILLLLGILITGGILAGLGGGLEHSRRSMAVSGFAWFCGTLLLWAGLLTLAMQS